MGPMAFFAGGLLASPSPIQQHRRRVIVIVIVDTNTNTNITKLPTSAQTNAKISTETKMKTNANTDASTNTRRDWNTMYIVYRVCSRVSQFGVPVILLFVVWQIVGVEFA